ncbi:uncharacterized protein LOC144148458 [Haemaphysalis longicornis]
MVSVIQDADCPNGNRCVTHRNYGRNSQCDSHKYCVPTRADYACNPGSIARVDDTKGYVCDDCATAASVLTGPAD